MRIGHYVFLMAIGMTPVNGVCSSLQLIDAGSGTDAQWHFDPAKLPNDQHATGSTVLTGSQTSPAANFAATAYGTTLGFGHMNLNGSLSGSCGPGCAALRYD